MPSPTRCLGPAVARETGGVPTPFAATGRDLSTVRCQTDDVHPRQLTRAAVEAALARAAKEGHALGSELVPVKVSKHGIGRASVCSCGWQSTPKTKPIKAFSAGFVHIGEVLGDALYDDWAGGEGASPFVPERQGDEAERSRPGGEGEPASTSGLQESATKTA